MERRTVLRAAAAVAAPSLVRARAQTRARRIGMLLYGIDPGRWPPGVTAAWKRLGWIVGETLLIELRFAARRMERMPELADELLRKHQVEVLMAYGGEAAAAAARLTTTVPIVFNWAFLPVECGLVDSYARPGRNCTGTALNAGPESFLKRFEFVRAAAPSARRIAFASSDSSQLTMSGAPLDLGPAFVSAAKALGFEMTFHVARRIEDAEPALAEAVAARAQVALISGDSFSAAAARVADFALRQRWVTATTSVTMFEAGLLLYHGPSKADFNYMEIRAVQMVDRILRGANPAEIPVEIPTHFQLWINLKAARALGLTLPQSLLLRADRVVE